MLKQTMVLGIACLMFSCSGEKKEEKSTESPGIIESVSKLNNAADAMGKVEELSNKLKKETPLTNEELKAVVPETLDGLKRTSYSAGGTVGDMRTINADYGDKYASNAKSITVLIIDGAGEAGSAVVSLMAMTLGMDTESESEGKKTKTSDVNGIRMQTEETKTEQSSDASIQFLHKDRYSVRLDGKGYTLKELESLLSKLNMDALK